MLQSLSLQIEQIQLAKHILPVKLIAPAGKLNKTLFWRKLAELILPTSSFGQLAKLILPAGKIHFAAGSFCRLGGFHGVINLKEVG